MKLHSLTTMRFEGAHQLTHAAVVVNNNSSTLLGTRPEALEAANGAGRLAHVSTSSQERNAAS